MSKTHSVERHRMDVNVRTIHPPLKDFAEYFMPTNAYCVEVCENAASYLEILQLIFSSCALGTFTDVLSRDLCGCKLLTGDSLMWRGRQLV
ncbi:hypothetical protein KC19_VG107700 [Ceratodon purpureus]|uniref:Uncharacterized protein n=1 Tax=Ceratodon purpureus TaxID=3225 RepID=A0A8T0HPA1_CERPU|nr:hypothetical protein KC19_VG107700 [Ceratodon purpureus]